MTPEQQQALSLLASKMVAERFERLSAFSDAELLRVTTATEELVVEGTRLRCVTFHGEEAKWLHSFGVVVEAETLRFGPMVSSLRLAKEAFWLKHGERVPFSEDDWRDHH